MVIWPRSGLRTHGILDAGVICSEDIGILCGFCTLFDLDKLFADHEAFVGANEGGLRGYGCLFCRAGGLENKRGEWSWAVFLN